MPEEAAPPPPAVAEASGLLDPAPPQAAGHHQPPSSSQLPVHPAPGAEGDAKAQPEFSASAAEFSPGVAAATAPLTDGVDVVNLLPPSHRALLRGGYDDYTGVWVAYYIGRLKSFNQKNGFGFIECMQCRKDYNSDVFVHKNFVPHPWNIGQPVEFAVMCNQRGQPQAFDVNWLPRLDRPQPRSGGAGGGLSTGGTGDTSGSGGRGAAGSAQAAVPATPPAEPRKLGTLKSFSAGQGYGFISCEEVFQMHQRDTYFDKGQLPPGSNWNYGQTVEFTLSLNQRNQPQARDINWDPVPRTPPPQGAAAAAQQPGPPKNGTRPNVAPTATERLQKLLVMTHEKNFENAIITAIDLQGGAAGDESDNVDYVMFVLDRMGTAEESVELVGDVAKMLLLVMLAKMLMTPTPVQLGREAVALARCQQMVKWFGKLAACLNPTSTMQVQENLPSVLQQISQHLRQALHDNPLVTEEEQATAIHSAFLTLQGKVKELPSGFSV